jgi:DNA-directed RNA polymerase specialized sigma24 family protein
MSESSMTRLINQVIQGDGNSWDRLYNDVKPELRKIAESHLRKFGAGAHAQATLVIDEALHRLIRSSKSGPASSGLSFEHRGAFFALMCRLMMQVLVDILRSERRHQTIREPEQAAEVPVEPQGLTYHSKVTVLEALIELDQYYAARERPRSGEAKLPIHRGTPLGSTHAAILFLRYYDDLSDSETAERLGMKKTTVNAQRKVAEARLRQMLERSFGD